MKDWINNLTDKPKEDIPVLVFLPNERLGENMQVKLYHFEHDNWSDTNLDYWVEDGDVSYWMELPEEPK